MTPPQETRVVAMQLRLSEVYKKASARTRSSSSTLVTTISMDRVTRPLDENDDQCRACGKEGKLVCCDGCPAAFHPECVGLDADDLPQGDWYCAKCEGGRGRRPAAECVDYEAERQKRIESNRQKMFKLILGAKASLTKQANARKENMAAARQARLLLGAGAKPKRGSPRRTRAAARPNTRQKTRSIRTSARLRG
ncbi:hypothetical protein A3770_04p29240 [Chloropicon primus]|uniref:PHD-type domain-containing protein n=1 Tax=Chloropicon primus TaxID=1764295 RepID=A0A5B8MIT3_9CHLO|nr:hypothetical protein A3770_04p29240 [Chloropicon primus]|mmetsp:Transcript_13996/g.39548  ORF Transcript_13996/g.39548 Transcript_13996/m.39548 type:complete len:195 (+) Transcript_13996:402-986(+)|eukprot:QDZ20406.1 hypothetical protein A3770_04p29240 [Chloropicon primus]